MVNVNLTNVELLKDLTTVEIEENFFDLHNDYACIDISYKLHAKSLIFLFEPCNSHIKKNNVYLLFEDITISVFNFSLKKTIDSSTLDNFYRGRYEVEDKLFEYSSTGQGYFYLEFVEGDTFEFFSGNVIFAETNKP